MKKALLLLCVGLCLLLLLGLLFSPIDPLAYRPQADPGFSGPLTANNALQSSKLIGLGKLDGPEAVAVGKAGELYTGLQDGRVVMVVADQIIVVAQTGGRPLGMLVDGDKLIVADAYKGLLSIDPVNGIRVLAVSAENRDFAFTNTVLKTDNGDYLFTDSSSRFNQSEYVLDALEARPWGRLLRYAGDGGSVEVLLEDLYFPNGIALTQNGDAVLINETYRYRVRRLWLKGPKAGQSDIILDNLPGFPDGLSCFEGRCWIAVTAPRIALIDNTHDWPWIKKMIAVLPQWAQPVKGYYGLVIEISEDGEIITSYQDPEGRHIGRISSATYHEGALYLGTLENDRIGVFPLP